VMGSGRPVTSSEKIGPSPSMRHLLLAFAAMAFAASTAAASPVGERHLTTTEPSAAVRDAAHSENLRITVWYPAAPGVTEMPLDIGPPSHPLFTPGSAAPSAPFADAVRHPVILFSHGFGGTARLMAWFGTALARAGYVVIAVDHPGNNGADRMTVPGAILFWERPGDLVAALARVRTDPGIAPHLDLTRLGVAGFSAGGFTSLAAAGAHVDIDRFRAFCAAHPTDGICAPQKEFAVSPAQAEQFLATPEGVAELARSHQALAIPGVRAVFVMAPALIQSLDPESLHHIGVPVHVVVGSDDSVASPATNADVVAASVAGATIRVLPHVGHYDFLADCTQAGDAAVPVCRTEVPRDPTHRATIDDALGFFDHTLRAR